MLKMYKESSGARSEDLAPHGDVSSTILHSDGDCLYWDEFVGIEDGIGV